MDPRGKNLIECNEPGGSTAMPFRDYESRTRLSPPENRNATTTIEAELETILGKVRLDQSRVGPTRHRALRA